MKKLLSFELRRLLRLKSFYVCISLTLLLAFANIYLSWDFYKEAGAAGKIPMSGQATMLSAVYDANFTMLMSIFVVLYACNDFDNQTAKNLYARGFSKTKIYFVKWLVVLGVISATFVCDVLFSWGVGSAFFGAKGKSGKYARLLTGQYLTCVAYSAFAFFIAFTFKKVGASVALAILGTIILSLLFALFDSFAKIESFTLYDYWIDSFLNDLGDLNTTGKRIAVCIACSVGYSALFLVGGCYLYNLREE